MTGTRTPTGADLPEGFIDRRSRTTLYYGACAGTVAMHVREGIHARGLSAGMVTRGTGSDVTPWSEELACRGGVLMLDARRVREDGVLIRVVDFTLGDAISLPDAEEMAPATVDNSSPINVAGITLPPRGRAAADAIESDDPSEGDEGRRAEPQLAMEAMARAMTSVPAAIPVRRPEVPELTGTSLENAKRLFALTAGQLADMFGVTERQMRRYLAEGGLPESRRPLADALAAIGLTVIGGLGVRGAREWLYSGEPTGAELVKTGRITELTERAEALRDSPFT